MGRRRSKKKSRSRSEVYLKVFAFFKCSKDNCAKEWTSAHGWTRTKDDIMCESCRKPAEQENVVDEMLKLDFYKCPNEECNGNCWYAIHDGQSLPQCCDKCEEQVRPEKYPQEMFGRHYWFKCRREICENPQEWEDFSLDEPITQRCTKCHSRGVMIGIKKMKPRPPGHFRRRRNVDSENSTAHNFEFCDMCQKIIQKGSGSSCINYKKVIITQVKNEDGTVDEVVVPIESETLSSRSPIA